MPGVVILVADIPIAVFALIALFTGVVGLVLSTPLFLVWTYHKRKMEEIKLQKQGYMTDEVRKEFAAMRAEIQSLRETATQYDISLENTLQQVERRLSYLERRPSLPAQESETQNVILGGR